MNDSSNRYCARLHIAVPDPEVVAAERDVSLFHVMLAALLEHGEPMTFDEIVARVARIPLPSRLVRADLPTALDVGTWKIGGLARCVDGARACPPEDCGGVNGYARLLEILFDPGHEQFHEMREWVGTDFQSERFDVREVNELLATIGWREDEY